MGDGRCICMVHVRMVSMPSACAALRFLDEDKGCMFVRQPCQGAAEAEKTGGGATTRAIGLHLHLHRPPRLPVGRAHIPRSSRKTASEGLMPLRAHARRYISGSGFLFAVWVRVVSWWAGGSRGDPNGVGRVPKAGRH